LDPPGGLGMTKLEFMKLKWKKHRKDIITSS
jgi:hypothetical protein